MSELIVPLFGAPVFAKATSENGPCPTKRVISEHRNAAGWMTIPYTWHCYASRHANRSFLLVLSHFSFLTPQW